MREEKGVTAEELEEVRSRRDKLWKLVKLKQIQNAPISKKDAAAYADELEDIAKATDVPTGAIDQIINAIQADGGEVTVSEIKAYWSEFGSAFGG